MGVLEPKESRVKPHPQPCSLKSCWGTHPVPSIGSHPGQSRGDQQAPGGGVLLEWRALQGVIKEPAWIPQECV